MPAWLVRREADDWPLVPRRAVRAEIVAADAVYDERLRSWQLREIGKARVEAQVDLGTYSAKKIMEGADDVADRADGNPVKQEIAASFIADMTAAGLRTFSRLFGA